MASPPSYLGWQYHRPRVRVDRVGEQFKFVRSEETRLELLSPRHGDQAEGFVAMSQLSTARSRTLRNAVNDRCSVDGAKRPAS